VLTSGVRGILNQRLVRRLCDECRNPAVGCAACGGTGFRGRFLIAELLTINAEFRNAILAKSDDAALEAIATTGGWQTIRDAATDAVAAGRTTADEILRVLGPAR
jgi:general secretion pathway protein E